MADLALARLVVGTLPGTDGDVAELAAIAAEGRKLSEQEWTELLARHDQYRAE